MNKLFRAGLYRLRKNKGAYACVIIPPIYSVCLMLSQYMQMKESGANYLLDPFLFHFFSGDGSFAFGICQFICWNRISRWNIEK